jgi:hypothetical protein
MLCDDHAARQHPPEASDQSRANGPTAEATSFGLNDKLVSAKPVSVVESNDVAANDPGGG